MSENNSGIVSVFVNWFKTVFLEYFLRVFMLLIFNVLIQCFPTRFVHKPAEKLQYQNSQTEHHRIKPVHETSLGTLSCLNL